MVISFSLNFIEISLYKTIKCYPIKNNILEEQNICDIKDCETKTFVESNLKNCKTCGNKDFEL